MLLDGRTVANHILANLLIRVDELEEKYDIQPHLAVMRVGEDPAITSYINQKAKMAKEIGAVLSIYNFPENVKQDELKKSIDFLQSQTGESAIHGLILQLPVPKHIDYEALILDIHPDKDVDGFRPNSPFTIPIASAILKLLEIPMIKESITTGDSFNEWLISKRIVVMGKGKTGGQPVIDLLEEHGASVSVIDSKTQNVSEITQNADIIVTAVGRPNTLTKDMIKKDSILIGIGMGMDKDGKFIGDYNEQDIKDKASWYTPIPGGVGPVNVACLMENLTLSAESTIKN